MSQLLTYGSVGRAPGNRCLYPEQSVMNSGSYVMTRYMRVAVPSKSGQFKVVFTKFGGRNILTSVPPGHIRFFGNLLQFLHR